MAKTYTTTKDHQITRCLECPYCTGVYPNEKCQQTGKRLPYRSVEDIEAGRIFQIPDWCPLENAPKKEG